MATLNSGGQSTPESEGGCTSSMTYQPQALPSPLTAVVLSTQTLAACDGSSTVVALPPTLTASRVDDTTTAVVLLSAETAARVD